MIFLFSYNKKMIIFFKKKKIDKARFTYYLCKENRRMKNCRKEVLFMYVL